jgi:hypothetical protein
MEGVSPIVIRAPAVEINIIHLVSYLPAGISSFGELEHLTLARATVDSVSATERNICSITCDTLHGSGIEKFGGDQSVRGRADGSERESGAFRHVE